MYEHKKMRKMNHFIEMEWIEKKYTIYNKKWKKVNKYSNTAVENYKKKKIIYDKS